MEFSSLLFSVLCKISHSAVYERVDDHGKTFQWSKESYTSTAGKLPFIGFTYFSFLLGIHRNQKWKVKNIYLFMKRTRKLSKGNDDE